jgi:hypothetical protein
VPRRSERRLYITVEQRTKLIDALEKTLGCPMLSQAPVRYAEDSRLLIGIVRLGGRRLDWLRRIAHGWEAGPQISDDLPNLILTELILERRHGGPELLAALRNGPQQILVDGNRLLD